MSQRDWNRELRYLSFEHLPAEDIGILFESYFSQRRITVYEDLHVVELEPTQ